MQRFLKQKRAMRRDNEQSLGEAIKGFLKSNHLDDKLLETEIYQRWEELAGRGINLKTNKVRFKEGELTVFLSSSVLRQELSMRKEEFRAELNMRLKGRPVRKLHIR